LQSAALGSGGEIFTLDMGQPVKIVDLARQLISLSGFTPDKDIRIEFTGLRPGEKLFEELSYEGEQVAPTRHPKIMRLLCAPPPLPRVQSLLSELVQQMDHLTGDELKLLLRGAVPEYQPQLESSISARSCDPTPCPWPNGHRHGNVDESVLQLLPPTG
jgi:FlaA1/EpsC-like NDP-sugar epimerase